MIRQTCIKRAKLVPKLEAGESAIENFYVVEMDGGRAADVLLIASLRPSFWPWHKAKRERFVAGRDEAGQLMHWVHQPVIE
jgi:hypothetical protein